MPLRRFSLLAFLIAIFQGALTVISELIVFGGGFNLDHPEVQPSYLRRVCGTVLDVLMQPGEAVWGALRVTPKSSLLDWAAVILNSLVWGVAGAMIVVLVLRCNKSAAN